MSSTGTSADEFDTAKDMFNNMDKDSFNWMSHHNDWNDHKTDYMGDMGWPDLNNFDDSDFGWGGHFGSKGVDSGLPDELTYYMGLLSSLLPDTNDYDDAMTGSWSTDSWSPGSWGSNGWDTNHMMTQTSSHFDFGKGPEIEDSKKPKGKGTKGKKKPKKGSQKGPDVGQIIGQFSKLKISYNRKYHDLTWTE